MLYCNACKQYIQQDGQYAYEEGGYCPNCGQGRLKEKQEPSVASGFNINLGDANAISGGVNLQDSHDVSNVNNVSTVDNSVHNAIDNSTNTNIVYEAQKSQHQLHADSVKTFLDEVVRLVNSAESTDGNGMLNAEAFNQLTILRLRLMLPQQEADSIIAHVQQSKMQTLQAQRQQEMEIQQAEMAKQMASMAPPMPEMPTPPPMPQFNPQNVQLKQMQGFNPLQAAQQMGIGMAGMGMQMPQMPPQSEE